MKGIYFDCFSGISGDMTLGALLDIGIDQDAFRAEINKLNIEGFDLVIEKVSRHSIHGTDVKVKLHESPEDAHDDHHHSSRCLRDIETLIDWSGLRQEVKDLSRKVFREIARAEAIVHDTSIDDVHFHEVGAMDSIIDIVGVAICLDMLGVKKVFSSPLHDGHGFIESRHGLLPVPVPAVMEMLKGSRIPYIAEDINTELVTPTGMGLIKTLALSYGNMPAMIIDSIGYGMGKREIGRLNALRIVIGDLFGETDMLEEVSVLETNIDDMSPEIMSYTIEKLMKEGALDAFCAPIVMKKGRPAFLLTVLCTDIKKRRMIDLIFSETTTLGIREHIVGRYCMDRKNCKVETEFGDAMVKVASIAGLVKIAPEFEDCRLLAERSGKPLREIYDIVGDKARLICNHDLQNANS